MIIWNNLKSGISPYLKALKLDTVTPPIQRIGYVTESDQS